MEKRTSQLAQNLFSVLSITKLNNYNFATKKGHLSHLKHFHFTLHKTEHLITYSKLYDGRDNCRVPTVFDSQQLLTRFNGQISRIVTGALQQKTVLSRVDSLGLFHNSKHCLIDFVGDSGLCEHGNVERRIIKQQNFGAFEDEEAWLVCLP
jgi:hypothetical protein